MPRKNFKPHFEHLKSKWINRHRNLKKKLWKKHKTALVWINRSSKNLMIGGTASLLMLSHPVTSSLLAQTMPLINDQKNSNVKERSIHTKELLIEALGKWLPQEVLPLTEEQENNVANLLSEYFGMPISAVLQAKRLDRSYGYIGAEQHLTRYPGDTIATHFDNQDEAQRYVQSGMAPGRGAWGYFTDSQASLTETDKLREKYYIAAPTFLAPGWSENSSELYKFFKFRKMIVVNPENGKAMVVVIGDAGPAEFTGKHLGGSPEVMAYLGRVDGAGKGPVLYFFIDDPDDKIPLGPITIK